MERNFKCPLCGKMEPMSKKLHGSWTCPNCSHTIIPTAEIRQVGKMPSSYISKIYGQVKYYRKQQYLKNKKFSKIA